MVTKNFEKFQSIVESSVDAIVSINQHREIDYCNPAFARIFGYKPDEIIGRSFKMLHKSESLFTKFGEIIYPVVNMKGYWQGEWEYKDKNGSMILMETVLSVQKSTDGQPIGYMATMREITGKKLKEQELIESEIRFRELVENISSGVVIYEAIENGNNFIIKDFNRAAEKIEKIKRQDLIGQKVKEMFPGIVEFGLLECMKKVWETGTPQHHPIEFYQDDRIRGWRENYLYKLPTGEIVAVYDDITDQKKIEQALSESEKRLKTILASIHAGIIIIDPETHKIIEVNAMALDKIGAKENEVIGHKCHKFICPAEEKQCPITDLGQNLDNAERVLITKSGSTIPILKTVTTIKLDGKDRLVESFLDISEIKKLENELRKLATTDPLTKVFNRRHFFELTRSEINRSRRSRDELSILLLDIDYFKQINDRFGHPAGDAVLVEICQAIASQLREHDIFGRVGGEEFAITFIKSNAKEAGRTAERLRRHIEMLTISYEGQDISCTVSCGVSQFTPKDDLEKAMKRADAALYNAKNQGRNQVYLV